MIFYKILLRTYIRYGINPLKFKNLINSVQLSSFIIMCHFVQQNDKKKSYEIMQISSKRRGMPKKQKKNELKYVFICKINEHV